MDAESYRFDDYDEFIEGFNEIAPEMLGRFRGAYTATSHGDWRDAERARQVRRHALLWFDGVADMFGTTREDVMRAAEQIAK